MFLSRRPCCSDPCNNSRNTNMYPDKTYWFLKLIQDARNDINCTMDNFDDSLQMVYRLLLWPRKRERLWLKLPSGSTGFNLLSLIVITLQHFHFSFIQWKHFISCMMLFIKVASGQEQCPISGDWGRCK